MIYLVACNDVPLNICAIAVVVTTVIVFTKKKIVTRSLFNRFFCLLDLV